MPMESVDNVLITQFSDRIHIKAQQKQSRLRRYVLIRDMRGDDYAYDILGQVEARELVGRFNLTQFDDLEHSRRQITKRQFSVTLPIDQYDVEGMLMDPQGQYAAACVRAMERAFDLVAYQAMFATVNTGRTFNTAVSFASDDGSTVTATGGLTLGKLLAVRQNFYDNEVDIDEDVNICIGITGEENTTLLQIDQLVNRFYTDQLRLEKGRVRSALGMDVEMWGGNAVTPLLDVTAGVRTCFALAENGLAVGMARDWDIQVDRRPDYVKVTQVQITGVLGAVRTEGKLLQKLTTTV